MPSWHMLKHACQILVYLAHTIIILGRLIGTRLLMEKQPVVTLIQYCYYYI